MNLLIPFDVKIEPRIINCHESFKTSEKNLHRYEINVSNYEGEGLRARIFHRTFPVMRETAASYIIDHYGKSKAVLKGDGKRFAHDTEEKALYSLRKRVMWRQTHAYWALQQAHGAIDAFNNTFGSMAQFANSKPLSKHGTSL